MNHKTAGAQGDIVRPDLLGSGEQSFKQYGVRVKVHCRKGSGLNIVWSKDAELDAGHTSNQYIENLFQADKKNQKGTDASKNTFSFRNALIPNEVKFAPPGSIFF